MKCLTSTEISDWLKKVGQIEDPHHSTEIDTSLLHAQFYVPAKFAVVECFADRFLEEVVSEGDILFQCVDCFPFEGAHKLAFDAFWKAAGEERSFEETPGCIIPFQEREWASLLFSLAYGFNWQCYLYASRDALMLYNWEGEIFDIWSRNPTKMEQSQELIHSFEFQLVPENAE
jgi:hypothetical protein